MKHNGSITWGLWLGSARNRTDRRNRPASWAEQIKGDCWTGNVGNGTECLWIRQPGAVPDAELSAQQTGGFAD